MVNFSDSTNTLACTHHYHEPEAVIIKVNIQSYQRKYIIKQVTQDLLHTRPASYPMDNIKLIVLNIVSLHIHLGPENLIIGKSIQSDLKTVLNKLNFLLLFNMQILPSRNLLINTLDYVKINRTG